MISALPGKCDSGFLAAGLERRTVVWAFVAIHLPEAIRKALDFLGPQSTESPLAAPHGGRCSGVGVCQVTILAAEPVS